jgi:hypothetical protein
VSSTTTSKLKVVSAAALAKCVEEWNGATLGTGKQAVASIAGLTSRALVFRYADGVCGLAFALSARRSTLGAFPSVFVTALQGDYQLPFAPVTGPRTPRPLPSYSTLERLSERQVNVSVQSSTGRIVPLPRGTITKLPYTILDTRSPCSVIVAPPSISTIPYTLVRSNVACLLVRTLAWAYLGREGALVSTSESRETRLIIGWRCEGTSAPMQGGRKAVTRFACSKASQAFGVAARRGHLIGG